MAPMTRRESEDLDVLFGVFGNHLTDDPVRCLAQSEDLPWVFFGMDARRPYWDCDLAGECWECWPLCGYCFHICNPHDGVCEDDECPRNALDIRTGWERMSGPPWFTGAYRRLEEGSAASPWRPVITRWRAPLRSRSTDLTVYYPEALAAWGAPSLPVLWRNILILSIDRPVKRPIPPEDAS